MWAIVYHPKQSGIQLKYHWAVRERCLLKKTSFAKEKCTAMSDRDLWGPLIHIHFTSKTLISKYALFRGALGQMEKKG